MSGNSTGWTLSRILPDTMREMSSTSSTICVSEVALRSIVSMALAASRPGDHARAQHPRVAEDRIERRPQFVRQAGEELVLEPARLLHAGVQPRVFERDRRPRGDADGQTLVLLSEPSRLGVAEEQPADDVAAASLDRHGQIAAHRQVAGRHAVVAARCARSADPCVMSALRTTPVALERRREHLGVARHRKLRERLARHARDRVERVRLAGLVRRRCRRTRRIRRSVSSVAASVTACTTFVAVEVGGDDGADVVQRFGDGGCLLRAAAAVRLRPLQCRDVAGNLRGADDRARRRRAPARSSTRRPAAGRPSPCARSRSVRRVRRGAAAPGCRPLRTGVPAGISMRTGRPTSSSAE